MITYIRFEIVVFWVMTLCSHVVGYERSEDLAASVFTLKAHDLSANTYFPLPQ
jgi:hypothetical protein